MDSSVSPKDKIWFLRVCHHLSKAVYQNNAFPYGNNKAPAQVKYITCLIGWRVGIALFIRVDAFCSGVSTMWHSWAFQGLLKTSALQIILAVTWGSFNFGTRAQIQPESMFASSRTVYQTCSLALRKLTFRYRASSILGQAFRYSPENAL